MTDANKALAHHWFDEVWNKGNESAIDKLFAPAGTARGVPKPTEVLAGPEAFKGVFRFFNSAFSNIHVHVDDVIAECDRVAIRWTATMTHTGDTLGFAPTGRTVTFGGASFICVDDGQITQAWNHMDFTHVLQELQSTPTGKVA